MKRLFKFSFIFLMAFLLSVQALAQGNLKVHLLEKGNGVPIRKAEIKIGENKFYTDPNGFADVVIDPSIKSIEVSRVGYETTTITQDQWNGKTEFKFYVRPAIGNEDEVIITGQKRPSISKKVISAQEASKVAPKGDPGQITKLMPGVQSNGFSSQVSVRGSAPSESLYYVDGLNVAFTYHIIGQLSVIPPEIFSDIEFSSGGFGVEYGDALGGVIVMRTKTEIPERPKTSFTLNLPFYSGVYHERPLSEDSGLIVSARKSYLEYILPKVLPKDSGVTIIPYFQDYQISYLHKDDVGHYKLISIAADDGLTAKTPSQSSQEDTGESKFFARTYFGRVGLERSMKLNQDWTLLTTPQIGFTKIDFAVNDLYFKIKYWDTSLPMEFTNRISKDERFYVGIEPLYGVAILDYQLPDFNENDPYYDVEEAPRTKDEKKLPLYQVSSWVARDFKLGDFLLTPGVRGSYFSPTKKTSIDPRLSTRYSVNEDNTLKMAVGQYSKAPENGEPFEGSGNPKLDHEHSMHYILGFETKWSDKWLTDFQVFYKTLNNRIVSDSETKYSNKGAQRSKGFETFVRRQMTSRWFGWLSYTFSKTEQRDSQDGVWHPGQYDQTHVLNLAGSYKWTATWETGGRYNFHSGDTYTTKMGNIVYNSNLDKYQARDNGLAPYTSRLPNYNELDVYSGHDFLWDEWKGTIRWGIEYLWFKRNAFGVRNNYDYSEETYFEGVPPIPYLEIRAEV